MSDQRDKESSDIEAQLRAQQALDGSDVAPSRRSADDTTPTDLARELGVDESRIRALLREQYGTLPDYTDGWHLNRRAADRVRTRFS